mgnify:CR=1 FL=1
MKDVLRDVGTIARALDSIANIEFKDLSLTKGQYLYLVRIYENEGIIPERLAELIKVDRTTLSRAIKKLEGNGFIEKKLDSQNKKIKHLYTTDKGKDVAIFILRENEYSNKVALKSFSKEEIALMHKLLSKMKKNIELDWDFVKSGNKRKY